MLHIIWNFQFKTGKYDLFIDIYFAIFYVFKKEFQRTFLLIIEIIRVISETSVKQWLFNDFITFPSLLYSKDSILGEISNKIVFSTFFYWKTAYPLHSMQTKSLK
jgi:hypothetical protein